MQTFVPFASYKKSAKSLDNKRLGKQRVEGCQILATLVGLSDGWRTHPAVKMWAGHEGALATYTLVMCEEWINRGYEDTRREFIHEVYASDWIPAGSTIFPVWWNDERVHDSHKAMLLKKSREFYQNSFGYSDDEVTELLTAYEDYYWPVGKALNFREL